MRNMGRVSRRIASAACLVLMALSPATHAGEFVGCKVVEVVVDGGNNGHVGLNCEVSGRPACAAASSYVAFDKLTEAGKQWLAAFLAAQASGARVSGVTADTCSPWQQNVVHLLSLRVIANS